MTIWRIALSRNDGVCPLGLEGIEKNRQLKPNLIVLDFSMPRMNGLQEALPK
jgi:CheY-like chemotaxis protein